MTHYDTLGVSEQASQDEIKRAYRKLANQHHPDKGGNTEQFQKIQTAYDAIGNEQARAQYDAERRGGGSFRFTVNGQPFEHHFSGGMEDIFSQFGFSPFGDPFQGMRQQRRNKDLRVVITVDLVDTLKDSTKTISVQTTNGDRSTVEVSIPRGVTPGTQIKYGGLGDNLFQTLPRGDLYVQFEVKGHPEFDIQGIDLYTTLKINSLEAMLGCDKTITGLDGQLFSITIPPGTQPSTKLRIVKQGLYVMNQNVRGNLMVSLNITTPILTPETKELAQQLLSTLNAGVKQ